MALSEGRGVGVRRSADTLGGVLESVVGVPAAARLSW